MKISSSVGYAISALVQLNAAGPKALVPCSAMAEARDLPERYLLQLLRKLVTAGVVQSSRGVKGGYRLAKPANRITLLEVVETIEGPIAGRYDTDTLGLSRAAQKTLESTLGAVAAETSKRLAAITLADMKLAK